MPFGTRVQRVAVGSSGATSSLTGSWSSTPVTGNLIILRVNSDATVTTPSGYTLAVSQVNLTGNYLYYRVATGTDPFPTVSPTASTSIELIAEEWPGNVTSSPLDKTASATGNSTGTTATTTQADEQAFAQLGSGNLSAAPTGVTWTNSFTTETGIFGNHATLNNRTALSPATKALSATGTVSSVPTPGSGTSSGCLVATFKAAAGGSTTNVTLSASAGSSAVAVRQTNATRACTAGSAASVVRQVGTTLSATAGSAAALVRQTAKALAGSAGSSCSIASTKVKLLALSCSAGSSAALSTVASHVLTLAATAAASVTLAKGIRKTMSTATAGGASMQAVGPGGGASTPPPQRPTLGVG